MPHARASLRLALPTLAAAAAAATALGSVAVAGESHEPETARSDNAVVRELPALRTRTSDTFETAKGTQLTRVYAAPVNYRRDGRWKPIDNSLQQSTDEGVAFENAANGYTLKLPAELGDRGVRVESDDQWVTFSLDGAHGTPHVNGNYAVYSDALPALNLTYTAGNSSVREALVLQSSEAPSGFSFRLDTSSGLTPKEDDAGGISFVDSNGNVRLSFAPPSIQDSSGDAASRDEVSMRLKRKDGGYSVLVSVDRNYLKDATYPVTVDPTTNVNASEDCYIVGGASASNHYCGYAWNYLDVGTDGVGQPRRAYAYFDTSAVPIDAEVLEGQFHLHNEDGSRREVDIHRLLHSSNSSRTWNTYDGMNPWAQPGGEINATPDAKSTAVGGGAGWYLFDARTLVQNWVDQSTQNYGVEIKDTATASDLMHFSASEQTGLGPYLEVEWQHRIGVADRWTFDDQPLSDRLTLKANVGNGNLIAQEDDINVPGTAGHDLTLSRFFNNLDLDTTGSTADVGNRWLFDSGWDVWLDFQGQNSTVVFHGPNGVTAPYDQVAGSSTAYTPPTGINADLVKNADGSYKLTYRQSHEQLNFNGSGVLTSDKDRNGNTIAFAYGGPGGRLTTITDTQGRVFTFHYGANNQVSSITDSADTRTWQYGYSGNLLTTYTNPDGKITRYTYDGSGNLQTVTDPRGNVTTIGYDGSGRVTSIQRPPGVGQTVGPTTTYAYPDPVDGSCFEVPNVVGETVATDPNGHMTKYCWDKLERVVRVVDGRGKVREGSYDKNSNVTGVTSAGGQAWQFGFDTDDRAKDATAPAAGGQASGLKESYGYDPAITDKTDPRFWLQKTLTDTQKNQSSYGYDSKGNLTDVTDALASQNNIHITPNVNGTTASIRDANGSGTTTYGYTGGNLTSVTPPSPLGAESYTYDSVSRVRVATDGRGKTATYTYDPIDRATNIAYSDGSSVAYGFDENGNMTSRTDATGQATYVYDKLNRLITENFPGAKTNNYTYDNAGNLKTLQDAGGTTTYNYGASNLLDSMQAPGDSAATTFVYNDDDQRTTTTYPNGVVMTATYEDGGAGGSGPNRLKRIKAVKGTTTISDFSYSYSNSSGDTALRQSVTDKSGATTTYTYDALNRLKTATNANGHNYTWSYDGNGNVLSQTKDGSVTSFGYNNANELCWHIGSAQASSACSPVPSGAVAWSNDASGELTTGGVTFSASYNDKQQTTSMNSILGGAQVPFTYAGPTQFERTAAGSTNFVTNALGVGSETTGTSNTYYRRDSDGGLASERLPSGAIYYYTFDGLGSVAALTDSGGTAQDTYSYEPYGTTSVSGTVPNPWRFTAAYFDSGTLTYKMGMRYYNSALLRWTQQDPEPGPTDPATENAYSYVGDDPVNRIDPTGQSQFGCYRSTRYCRRQWWYNQTHYRHWPNHVSRKGVCKTAGIFALFLPSGLARVAGVGLVAFC